MRTVLFAAVVSFAAAAAADPVVDAEAKLQMDTPAGYTVATPSAAVTVYTDLKNEVQFVLVKVADRAAADKAVTQLGNSLKTDIPDLHEAGGKPTVGKRNGLEVTQVERAGTTIAGDPTEVTIWTIRTPTDRYVVVGCAAKSKTRKAHAGEIKKFLDSFRPAT